VGISVVVTATAASSVASTPPRGVEAVVFSPIVPAVVAVTPVIASVGITVGTVSATAIPIVAIAVGVVVSITIAIVAIPIVALSIVALSIVAIPVMAAPIVVSVVASIPIVLSAAPVIPRRASQISVGREAVAAKVITNDRAVGMVIVIARPVGTGAVTVVPTIMKRPMGAVVVAFTVGTAKVAVRTAEHQGEIEAADREGAADRPEYSSLRRRLQMGRSQHQARCNCQDQ
jgi:hypothetical protein